MDQSSLSVRSGQGQIFYRNDAFLRCHGGHGFSLLQLDGIFKIDNNWFCHVCQLQEAHIVGSVWIQFSHFGIKRGQPINAGGKTGQLFELIDNNTQVA